MRMMRLVAILIPLAACATDGAAPSVCAPWRPIFVTPREALDRGTAADILAHNETGGRLCGWKGREP
jgi:hypothetical protein